MTSVDPLAALTMLSKLGGPEHYAIGTLRDAGIDVQVVDVTTAKDAKAATAADAATATGRPEQGAIALDLAGGPAPAPVVDPVDVDDEELLSYVEGLLVDYERSRPRSQQVALGPSEIGHPCQRNIALKLAGFPERPGDLPWAPLQGVWVHAGMEDVLAFDNAGRPGIDQPTMPDSLRDLVAKHTGDVWIVEGAVEVDENIRGHSDAFLVVAGQVVDWKYAGKTAVNKLRAAKKRGEPPAKQVGQEYRVQGHLYGYAVRRKGRPVRKVSVVFLGRSHDFNDSAVWAEEYREDVARWAIERYYRISAGVDELDLATHRDRWEQVPAAPGPDACKWCPFRGHPCPGDTAAAKSSADRFGAGLI